MSRYGKVKEGDNIFNFLKSRDVECDLENDFHSWKNGEILYIVKDNKKREEINMQKLAEFEPGQPIFCSDAKDTAIDSDQKSNISKDIPYTQTGYIPSAISVKKNSPIMLTQNHSNRRFREDGISNGNRGFVDRVDFSKKPGQENEISCIWVEFYDQSGKIYKEQMKKKRNLYNPNPNAIPILPINATFTLEKTRRKYKRFGIPLILGFCHTAHKIQVKIILTFLINLFIKFPKYLQGTTLKAAIVDFGGDGNYKLMKHGKINIII